MQAEQNTNNGRKLRFGFLSTAQIGRKNWKAIYHSGNSIVTAVASRDAQRGRDFIATCQQLGHFQDPPAALEGYEAVLASKDVDAVYSALPTGIRKEWVIRAAEAGKHVVCEKPCALNASDLQQMIAACRKNRVQFIDGVMFMHHPRMEQMRRAIDDHSAFGAIKRIMSVFSFRGGEDFVRGNIRTHGELEPAGSLGDLGWYCIRFILWAMHWQLPRAVAGRTLTESQVRGPRSVPMDFSGELIFEGGASAGFFSSFLVANQQWVNISGTKGSLRVADFVHTANDLQSEFELDNKMMRVDSGTTGTLTPSLSHPMGEGGRRPGEGSGDDVAQQTQLFRNFSNQVASGKLEASWPEMALITQRVMDACLESARDGSRTIELRK